jgi:hypothetical protein
MTSPPCEKIRVINAKQIQEIMQTFLQYVARDILAKHPDGLNDIAIVFPNKRASLFFNQALYEANGQTLWSPAYLTISDLFRRHSQWEVPDQMLLVFKLYNIFCEVTGSDETLDHFYSWGQLLLADFDDVDKNLADADKLFVNLEAWQELKDFSFLTDTQTCGGISRIYTMPSESISRMKDWPTRACSIGRWRMTVTLSSGIKPISL